MSFHTWIASEACASNTGQTTSTPVVDAGQATGSASAPAYAVTDPPAQAAPSKVSDSTAALASTPGRDGDYRIGPRDVLDINVFQVNDLNKSVQVNEDGSVTLPLVGKVEVGGKTTQQAEVMIADLLRKRYMQSPQVSVSLKQYGQRVTVNGEVKTPRVLSIDGKVTKLAMPNGHGEISVPAGAHVVLDPDARILKRSIAVEDYQAWKAAQAKPGS